MTTQTVHLHTFDYGASLSSATLRAVTTDNLVATADSANEVTADSGVYAIVFGETSVIPAGTYRLRAVVSGAPLNRYVTLAGTDGEVVQSSSVPSGGLTTEQEETLNTIYSQTSQITGSRINTTGPVSAAGDITLIVGKDYKVASASELTISVPDTAGALYADFTSGALAASKAFGMSRTNGDAVIAGTVASITYATNVTTFKVEIPRSQLLDSFAPDMITDDWTYQIERVTSDGDKVVGVQGAGTVALRAV